MEDILPSDRFEASLPFVLRWEGGFVDHPADPGGATNKGVTQGVYDRWRRDRGEPRRSVREITDAEMHAIYAAGYWVPPGCDRLQARLDLVQFDTAVNMGPGRAVRFLQGALGCGVDGKFGPVTASAAARCNVDSVIAACCDAREAFYEAIIRRKPSQEVFRRGWMNRLNALRNEVARPGLETPAVVDFGDAPYIARVPDIGVDPDYDF